MKARFTCPALRAEIGAVDAEEAGGAGDDVRDGFLGDYGARGYLL